MSSKKQTAVEWLIWEISKIGLLPDGVPDELYQQVIAMEKQQMDKVSEDWFVEGCSHMKDNKRIYQSFEQYYKETYGN